MVKIRLMRMGARNQPVYRIIVVDSRSARDGGRAIERIGTYDPCADKLFIDTEKFDKWIKCGAQPTDSIRKLVKRNEARSA